MKMHWQTTARGDSVACGRDIWMAYGRTRTADKVTCLKCKANAGWQAAASTQYNAVAEAEPQSSAGEHLYTQEQVTNILNMVFDAAHEAADDQGVCDTYNDIIEEVEAHVPSWYTLPPRKRSWSLTVNSAGRYTESMTKDELIEAIKNDPEEYLSIEAS
jgi:hypothetical protein